MCKKNRRDGVFCPGGRALPEGGRIVLPVCFHAGHQAGRYLLRGGIFSDMACSPACFALFQAGRWKYPADEEVGGGGYVLPLVFSGSGAAFARIFSVQKEGRRPERVFRM